jgi:hypothetical protein
MSGTDASEEARWIADVISKRRELRDLMLAEPVVSTNGFTIAQARDLSLAVRWAGLTHERAAAICSASAVEFFGPTTPLESINATAVEQWRAQLSAQGDRPVTINRKLSALKALFSDAQSHGRISPTASSPALARRTP